ncbi:phosphatase PAP2 family protein [Xanthobacter agilis]|uniref:Autotransporter-associated beta strand protein n=1 Tax=Xanthobacter agilis TaxID=47492 RepID=A0ABU0L9Q2_XANAG|nr:phosphatase PAP2 family protein [Xanthobacter agilis]MDQ0503871.1 autotransporter-associated beta strand protein [Xanthobacter agilis]
MRRAVTGAGSALVLALLPAPGRAEGMAPADGPGAFCTTPACAGDQQQGQGAALTVLHALGHTAAGQRLLEANAAVTTHIYDSATLAQRIQAAQNARDPDNPAITSFNIWNLVTGPASTVMMTLASANRLPGTIAADLSGAFSVEQVGYLKNTFPQANIYGDAYHAPPGLVNDPRPYLALPAIGDAPWRAPATPPGIVAAQQKEWRTLATMPSFPSGHTFFGTTTALYYATLTPTYYQQLIGAGQAYGIDRNIIGVHYALDVIGGRIVAQRTLAELLAGNPAYSAGFPARAEANAAALAVALGPELVSPLHAACRASVANCLSSGFVPGAKTWRAARQKAFWRLTYGLPPMGENPPEPVIPDIAERLIATRFPYLDTAQRNAILATTSLPANSPLDGGLGWARLDLYAAGGGYGAFPGHVTVTLDAANGGLHAFDMWTNDISGPGGLTKTGSGTLLLAGDGTFTGGTQVQAGALALSGALAGSLAIAPEAAVYSTGGYVVAPDATFTNAGQFSSVGAALYNFGAATNTGRITGDLFNFGRLSGAGTLAGTLRNAGLLQPDQGPIRVASDTVLEPESVVKAPIGAQVLEAQGAARLGGRLELSPGLPSAAGRSWILLTAAGGVTGEFDAVASPDPDLDAVVTVAGTAARVTLTPRTIAPAPATHADAQ